MSNQVRRGELRIIMPSGAATVGSRLGVVLDVDTTCRFAEIALAHPYRELATSADGVVPGTLAGTPYDVVVQTDLRGVVWTRQMSRRVGQLADATLGVISDLVSSGRPDAPAGVRIGVPLAGPYDRRWPFKVAEGEALDLLTSACAAALIDGRGCRPPAR